MPEELRSTQEKLVETIVGTLTSQHEHEVVVYYRNLSYAKRLLLAVYLRLDASRIVSLNKNESLEFRAADGSVNSLFVYPKAAQNLRGTGMRGSSSATLFDVK